MNAGGWVNQRSRLSQVMSSACDTVLIVDADRDRRRFLLTNLGAEGYQVLGAPSAASARQLLDAQRVDLTLVDRALPDADGLDLVTAVRASGSAGTQVDANLPVIITSEAVPAAERVRALDAGGDDYLSRPYTYAELRARIAAQLRRRHMVVAGTRLRVGPLTVDVLARQAWVNDRPVMLSGKEFSLLQTLAREPVRVFSRDELMTLVWSWPASTQVGYRTRTLDQHASRLRRKLAAHGVSLVINVWGVGYRLLGATDPVALTALALG